MESNSFLDILFMLFGLLMFGAALFNWEYFFTQRKAQMLVKFAGIVGARLIYALLGLFFTLFGANSFFGLEWF